MVWDFKRWSVHCVAMELRSEPQGSGSKPPTLNETVDVQSQLNGFCSRRALGRQTLKQVAGGLQIRGREAFGEPIINRCKRCSRLVVAALAHPQTGNAESYPQFPKQSALLAGDFSRMVEAIFRHRGGLIRGLLEQHFAFDAEQLRRIPPVPLCALAVGRHRVVHGKESLVEPPCPGKP
jgi:hypothetical protein